MKDDWLRRGYAPCLLLWRAQGSNGKISENREDPGWISVEERARVAPGLRLCTGRAVSHIETRVL